MYSIYTAVLRAALPCSHKKITIFRDILSQLIETGISETSVLYLRFRLGYLLNQHALRWPLRELTDQCRNQKYEQPH